MLVNDQILFTITAIVGNYFYILLSITTEDKKFAIYFSNQIDEQFNCITGNQHMEGTYTLVW